MKTKGLMQSARIVGAGTGASRLLGLVRESLMAYYFGTSLAKSAFDVAFKVPNLFRRLLGEGALSAAFVPVFSESLEREGPEAANALASKVFTMLVVVLLMIVGGGILLTTAAMRGLELGAKAAAVLPLLRIMLPYVLFICLVALAMGSLNAVFHFATPALAPVLLNLVWIGFLVWVCPRFGDTAEAQVRLLAWGILIGGAAQLAVQLPVLARHGIRWRLNFRWSDRRVARMLAMMGPAALGMGVHQLNVVIDGILALWVGAWAPAALTYAERLIYLPLGIFATALGTVLLPTYSQHAARREGGAIASTFERSLRGLLVIMTPAAVGLIVLALPIVRLLFQWNRGVFQDESALQTVRALWFYAPGLIVFSVYKVVVPAFYALKDTRTPVRVGFWCVGLNLALNLLFIWTWPPLYRHAGLALATVIASAVNGGMLALLLHRRIEGIGWGRLTATGARALAGAFVMAMVLCLTGSWFAGLASGAGKGSEWAVIGGRVLLGMLVYGAWLFTVGRADWQSIRRRA